MSERNFVDYAEARMSREEMLQICREGALGYLQTMKAHKLLGVYSRAEVNLVGWVDKWTSIGGRADVIIRREDTGITIIDGKNTKFKMRFTDPDQLRWYALAFRLSYKQLPDRLGFVWYRFPHGMETTGEDGEVTTESGVEWVEFTEDDLRGLAQRAIEARNGMRKKNFEANPSPNQCRWCDFESVCPDRQAQREMNASKRKKSDKIEEISGGGFSDFTL